MVTRGSQEEGLMCCCRVVQAAAKTPTSIARSKSHYLRLGQKQSTESVVGLVFNLQGHKERNSETPSKD
jgi:hypothetical protein